MNETLESQIRHFYWFAQEFLCQFHDAEQALFREELVRAAFRDDIRDLEL